MRKLFFFLFFYSLPVLASDRLVTSDSGTYTEGSLPLILYDACDTAGDDHIRFAETRLSEIRINLENPLVIPEDCQGTVTIEGSDEVDTLLDGASLNSGGTTPGDSCILHVYSDGHTIRNFSFVNNERGAGLCLFGKNNLIEENRPHSNRYGIVVSDVFDEDYPGMDGSGNQIQTNTITQNSEGGVLVIGDKAIEVTISQNSIYENGTILANLDLGGDGWTLNDLEDDDQGPNTLLNHLDHFQVFPLVPGEGGAARYWGWGAGLSGSRIELYKASDGDEPFGYGGGEDFVSEVLLTDMTFAVDPGSFATGDIVNSLTFDDSGNTSEFSLNVHVGEDEDMDGILDAYEIDTDPANTDSDGDYLPDAVEDRNRNGVWDEEEGETSAANPDSDGDGLSDWVETKGDGIYDEGIDANPLSPDSDEDGLNDLEEDSNENGIWEAYLGETSPLMSDSDSDGYADSADNCPVIYNPGQEDWYCQQ